MKRERIVPIIIAAVLVTTAGIALALIPATRRWLFGPAGADGRTISASGFIEADATHIAAEVGGRIVEVAVAEGERVEAGQVLLRLDDTLIQAQVEVAQATLEVAQATLAQARAGARDEQIRRAQAQLAQAEAARDGARQGWQDALALLNNPRELEAQIALAEAQVAEAEAALRQAGLLRDTAQIADDNYQSGMSRLEKAKEALEGIPEPLRPGLPGLPLDFHLLPNSYWKSWVGVNTAQAAYDGAQQALAVLRRMRNDPQQLQAQVNAAEAQYHATEAAVALAQAQLDGLRAGASAEEIAAVEAQVQQAQAQLDTVRVVLDKMTITAPSDGQVLSVVGRQGELAAPGATLVTLADLDPVRLTIYVPENRLGLVQIGQRVEVRVDSFPERVFVGQVAAIASQAEFTPRNVQTEEERVNMVFAVKVTIPNPNGDLKPGMPADALIMLQEQ